MVLELDGEPADVLVLGRVLVVVPEVGVVLLELGGVVDEVVVLDDGGVVELEVVLPSACGISREVAEVVSELRTDVVVVGVGVTSACAAGARVRTARRHPGTATIAARTLRLTATASSLPHAG